MVKFTIGEKSPLPELKSNLESVNLKGLYVVGSLSGIPLIKNAIDQGRKVVLDIASKIEKKGHADYDIIIIGGGPGGVTAAIEAKRAGLKYVLIEKGRLFELVHQYPKKKPIYAEPDEMIIKGDLAFNDKPKEELLNDWEAVLKKERVKFIDQNPVKDIVKKKTLFKVKTVKGEFDSKFVILAIGDSGSPRKLNVPGESQDNVHHKLTNPEKFQDKNVLVVGGGNSAIEAAIALAQFNKVTLSYRQDHLFRITKKNKEQFNALVDLEKIELLLKTQVKEIKNEKVQFKTVSAKEEKKFDDIFVLIGFDPSIEFMEKINIKLAKTIEIKDIFGMMFIGFIMLWIYSYNKGVSAIAAGFSNPLNGIFDLNQIGNAFNIWGSILFALTIGMILFIQYAGFRSMLKLNSKSYGLVIGFLMATWLVVLFSFGYNFFTTGSLFNLEGAFWPYYTLLYSLVVTSFGFWSILKYKKSYIWKRTLALMFSQTFLLFLLPVFIFKDWRTFFFVYVWPLGPDALTNSIVPQGSALAFISNTWFVIAGILLSFVVFTVLVYYKGRGAVCSWFCGCGALAETLGDPFRTKTPQGEKAKWLEYASYVLLGFAAAVTSIKAYRAGTLLVYTLVPFFTLFFMWFTWKKIKNNIMWISVLIGIMIGLGFDVLVPAFSFAIYKYFADFFLAGWLALTTYFFIGGRIWCRYFCPLIAYLGVISSIGRFKIRPQPDKCISCGLCTRNCHMGIDVMSYAQKGHDMKEPSCVGCGICVEVCPMDLFDVKYDNKTIGPGTSFQMKANPNKFQILAMGGKPEAAKTLLGARAKLMNSNGLNIIAGKGINKKKCSTAMSTIPRS